MTLLIFFAIALVTVVLAILINRIVRCPILVGFVFFSVTLLVAIILSNITLIVLAIILGILAFLAAFFDCIFKSSRFFRDNHCLNCHNPYDDDWNCGCNDNHHHDNWNCGCNNNNHNDTLAIVNSNGEIVARINGNSVSCHDNDHDNGCGCRRRNSNALISELELTDGNISNAISSNSISTTSSNECCNCRRNCRRI